MEDIIVYRLLVLNKILETIYLVAFYVHFQSNSLRINMNLLILLSIK